MSEDRFTTLYRTYGPTLYARCRHILGDDASAADATQETFLRLHKHLDRAANAEEALAWIYRVATNHCLNQVRNARRRAEPMAELPEHAGPSPEGALLERDLARRLVATLPEKLAQVAWLHHADGLTQEEVARVLGVSRRTVVYRLAELQQHAQSFVSRGVA